MTIRSETSEAETTSLLELPVRGASAAALAAQDEEIGTGSPGIGNIEVAEVARPAVHASCIFQHIVDIAASILFWYALLFVYVPDNVFYAFWAVVVVFMIGWRIFRAQVLPQACGGFHIPYTSGYVANGGRELFLVATIHISPRAPLDAEAVIGSVSPDVVMIELDEERLDRMRDPEIEKPREPSQHDLQPIQITQEQGAEPVTVFAQRAMWNAERSGETISGDIVFDEDNVFGLKKACDGVRGNLCLVCRGSPGGEFAPFALKAHNAARAGAEAVLVINSEGSKLPLNRIGTGALQADLRVALSTWSCGFPPIPLLLIPHEDGSQLRESSNQGKGVAHAEFKVKVDDYPRRTLRRRLCQSCALLFTGIGILYGIIQCFAVEVGAEFLRAEIAARTHRIPCACIDVDMNSFLGRLGAAVIPTPCNLWYSLVAWLAFPRHFFFVLFPKQGNVDIVGSIVLHAASFPCRTWVAFILAGFGASFVTTHVLQLLVGGAEGAAEATGAVKKEDREIVQSYIMLLTELYVLPRVYESVAASRDEAMYKSIVATSHKRGYKRMAAVVGAGHANGILERARTRGL